MQKMIATLPSPQNNPAVWKMGAASDSVPFHPATSSSQLNVKVQIHPSGRNEEGIYKVRAASKAFK